jgi:hypothetical protein
MTPDKKAAVLNDYRAKKATSAAELSKLHGVSRSAVYRLLLNEKRTSESTKPTTQAQVSKAKLSQAKPIQARTQPQDNDNDSYTFDSDEEQVFQRKAERFAEDLGLPMSSDLRNLEDDQEDSKAREQRLDEAADALFGSFNKQPDIPEDVLVSVFDEPPPSSQKTPKPRIKSRFVEEPEVSESPVVKQDLIQRIIFNVENFGALLNTIVGSNPQTFIAGLSNLSVTELEKTLSVLERTRSIGNIANGLKQTFFMVASATEAATSMVGVKAQGFTEKLRAEDQQITMIMKELAIDNWERVKSMDSPTARLGVLFCVTLAQTDSVNRLNEALRPQLESRQVPEDFLKAHSDL